jgi:hypothetical protein
MNLECNDHSMCSYHNVTVYDWVRTIDVPLPSNRLLHNELFCHHHLGRKTIQMHAFKDFEEHVVIRRRIAPYHHFILYRQCLRLRKNLSTSLALVTNAICKDYVKVTCRLRHSYLYAQVRPMSPIYWQKWQSCWDQLRIDLTIMKNTLSLDEGLLLCSN